MIKRKDKLVITSIAAGYNLIYNLYVMKALYYSTMIEGLHLTHYQLGRIYSMYGILAMFSYLCGAFFLKKFQSKKLIYIPLMIASFVSLFLASLPSYTLILLMFGIAGFTVGATFYPAYLSILHNTGNPENQGKVFSTFFFMNSIFGSTFSIIGFKIISLMSNSESQIRFLFLFYGILTFISAIFSIITLKDIKDTEKDEGKKFDKKQIMAVVKNKNIFLTIIVVFANYVAVANFTYILPYLSYNFNLPDYVLNTISVVRMYLIIIIAAPIAGSITDKLQSSAKLMRISFILYIATIFIMVFIFPRNPIMTIICSIMICFFAYGGKSMALITIDETGISRKLYGVAISYISFVAYSPDVFYFSLSGWILDNCKTYGYSIVFVMSAVISLIGLIASSLLIKRKYKSQ